MKLYKYYLLSAFLFIGTFVRAQHYNLIKFNKKNGLPGSNINAVYKDSKNYIWLGTQEGGLCRFNGKDFTTYSKINGLHTNEITSICEDIQGNLWIGTTTGVSFFDGKKFNRILEKGLINSQISSIYRDKKSNLWFTTRKNGLTRYDGKTFITYTTLNGLPTNDLFCILEDKQGNYWIGTYKKGLCKIDRLSLDSKKLSVVNFLDDKFGSNNIFSLLEDHLGRIWIGTTNAFISIYQNGKITTLEPTDIELKTAFVSQMIQDSKGDVWIASYDFGLIKYSNNKFKRYLEKDGFSSNLLLSIAFDYENNLWIGNDGQGVCVYKNEAFLNFNEKDGLPNKAVNCFLDLGSKKILIGTSSGLVVYDGTKIIQPISLKIADNHIIRCLAKDNENTIWIGTESEIIKISAKDFSLVNRITTINKSILSSPYVITTDKEGTVWVATDGSGIINFKKDVATQIKSSDGLINNTIYAMSNKVDSTIWVGYLKGGASKIEGKTITHFNKKNQLGNNTVGCIAINSSKQVFFGTTENGLFCFDTKSGFSNISQNEGLSSNYITSICVDYQYKNILWIGTPEGLNKLTLDENLKVVSIKIYTEQNGLIGNGLTENALIFNEQKNILIGSAEGLSIFDPSIESKNLIPPSFYLSGIRLFFQPVNWQNYTDQVDLKTGLPISPDLDYKNNHLTFDFQSISIDKGIKYTFELEGFDKEWSPLSTTTEAIYSNIPSGKSYTFKVKAVNSDGIWSNKNIEFKFTIESPIWQRWWFISLSILFLLLSIFLYINWRTAKLAKEKKLLEDTVEERTLELKDTNEQLSEAFQDIKDSINYAQKIQQSILPVDSKVKAALPDSFILFKPRDIVSGDFYWFGSVTIQGVVHHIIAAADCTGHGVPGAFMSMVGNTILNEIVTTKHIVNPSEILSQLHHGVKTALQQSENESRDGMDICLCCINTKTNLVLYSGAFNPLWILRNDGTMEIIKATKAAIGGFTPDDQVFETHQVLLNEGEAIYLFTDGYADQFGGELGKKLTAKKFRDALLSVGKKPMREQGFFLDNFIEIWKGKEGQVDDILVIGIKV